jgi:hypothetical protein
MTACHVSREESLTGRIHPPTWGMKMRKRTVYGCHTPVCIDSIRRRWQPRRFSRIWGKWLGAPGSQDGFPKCNVSDWFLKEWRTLNFIVMVERMEVISHECAVVALLSDDFIETRRTRGLVATINQYNLAYSSSGNPSSPLPPDEICSNVNASSPFCEAFIF